MPSPLPKMISLSTWFIHAEHTVGHFAATATSQVCADGTMNTNQKKQGNRTIRSKCMS